MSHVKKNIFENPCSEQWESMQGTGCVRQCSVCHHAIHDVTHLNLKTIANSYLNTGKCVRMDAGQADFFRYLRGLKHAAGIATVLMMTQPAVAQQTNGEPEKQCHITGYIDSERKADRLIYIFAAGKLYETQTDGVGFFSFTIPRNVRIERSNIEKLDNRKFRRKKVHLKKVKLPAFRVIGTPSF